MQSTGEFLRLIVVLMPFALLLLGMALGLVLYYLRQYRLVKRMRWKYLDDLEKERRMISMDLHDLYGPYSLQIRERLSELRPGKTEQVDEIDVLMDKLSKELMLKNQELYPLHILDESFEKTLSFLVEILSGGQCEIALNYELKEDIPSDAKIHLYRILQELLLNAIRHIQPLYIQIEVERQDLNAEFSLYYPNPEEKLLRIKSNRLGQSIITERLKRINALRIYELKEKMTLETIILPL